MNARTERGSITPFVVIVSLGILMLAALVVDGGRQLNAKGRAVAYAQEAARAGSQAIDVTDPKLDLIPALAMRAARAYCQQAMANDEFLTQCAPSLSTVSDSAGTFLAVRVRAEISTPAILLGIINRHTLRASGIALARPVSGITNPDSGKVSEMPPPEVNVPGDEAPGTLTPEDPTVSPCVPVPPSPTPTPTPTPKDTPRPDPSGKPRPSKSPEPSPTPWPPPLPDGESYCVTDVPE